MENNKKELIGKEIKCKVCNRSFILTEGEQAWYKDMGFVEPKKCWHCRKAAKEREV